MRRLLIIPVLAVGCTDAVHDSERTSSTEQPLSACVALQRGLPGSIVGDGTVYSTAPSAVESSYITTTISPTSRALLRFDLSAIPAGATIDSATLSLHVSPRWGTTPSFIAHRAAQAWTESTATWNNVGGASSAGEQLWSSGPVGAAAVRTYDSAVLVQDWVNGAANTGWIFVSTSGTAYLGASENTTVSRRPSLSVCYTTGAADAGADADDAGSDAVDAADEPEAPEDAAPEADAEIDANDASDALDAADDVADVVDSGPDADDAGQDAEDAAPESGEPVDAGEALTFGVVGDFGAEGPGLTGTAALVASWNPDHVLTTGDNIYSNNPNAYDNIVGRYYHQWIAPYSGAWGAGASSNRFWPSAGNHDWNHEALGWYRTFFTLPNNERYYDVALGLVHVFHVDSDYREPDGVTASSTQAQWLQQRMQQSTACWKLVIFHEPAFASNTGHAPRQDMRWPFQQWGADLVMSGHAHNYERLNVNGMPVLVNGMGGGGLHGATYDVAPESVLRYAQTYGAVRLRFDRSAMRIDAVAVGGAAVDSHVVSKSCP